MMASRFSTREKRLIQVAVVLIILFLLYLLFRGGPEPVTEPEPMIIAQPERPMPLAPPPIAAVPVAPPAPVADITGLKLHGLLASGAVIEFANGSQRLVPIGREALPGLTLRRIEQNAAVFDSGGGELRLGFDGPVQSDMSVAQAPVAVAPGSAQREESLRYRLGLAPRMAGGRVTGFTVRDNVEMPALARAGIRPGDVIVTVDGAAFDEERMQALAGQIANGSRILFEVERGGSRIRIALQKR
jgi:general secretion pathway protein C